MQFGYHITEEEEKMMVEELAKRNEKNIQAEDKVQQVTA